MKKLFTISLLLMGGIIVLYVMNTTSAVTKTNSVYKVLASNEAIIYNKTGFKQSDVEKLKQNKAVDTIDLEPNEAINLYSSYEKNLIRGDVNGMYLPLDFVKNSNIKIEKGRNIEKENEVIVAKSFDDFLIKNKIFNKTLLNTTYQGYKIVGLYDDNEFAQNYLNKKTSITDKGKNKYEFNANNVFISAKPGVTVSFKEQISNYNYDQVGRNRDYNIYKETCDDDGFCLIDYDASVKNGVKGLIDPDSKEYGDTFNQFAFIQFTDDANVDSEISTIKSNMKHVKVATNKTTLSDFVDFNQSITKAIVLAVILLILIYFPFFLKRK